jgi:hypothetical protein
VKPKGADRWCPYRAILLAPSLPEAHRVSVAGRKEIRFKIESSKF